MDRTWPSHGGKPGRPVAERFWEKVDRTGDCWLWQGGRSYGYGAFFMDGRNRGAHRVALALSGNAPPDDSIVMHSCDNPPCVRPSHLSIGTKGDNNRDASARGRKAKHLRPGSGARIAAGLRALYAKSPETHGMAKRTACSRGHAYVPGSFRLNGNHRICRPCAAERERARRAHGTRAPSTTLALGTK